MTPFLKVYFAVEAPLSVFFYDTGRREHVCSGSSHTVSETAKFCEQRGAAAMTKPIMEPTEVFRAFCVKMDCTPEYAFDALRKGEWEWSDEEGSSHTLGWHKVNYLEDSESLAESSSGKRLMALGIELASRDLTDDIVYESRKQELSYTLDDLAAFTRVMQEVKDEFNIPAAPKLYVQGYLSY